MNYRVKLCTIILVALFAMCGAFVLAAPENEEGGEAATAVTEAPTVPPTEPPTREPTQPPATEATEPPATEPPTSRPTEASTQPATSSPEHNDNDNNSISDNDGQDSATRPRPTYGQSVQSEKVPSTDSIFVERTMPVSPTHMVTDEQGSTYYATNSYLSNQDGGSGSWLKYLIPSILIVIAIGVIFYVNFVVYNKKHNADRIRRNLYSPAESSRKNKRRKK